MHIGFFEQMKLACASEDGPSKLPKLLADRGLPGNESTKLTQRNQCHLGKSARQGRECARSTFERKKYTRYAYRHTHKTCIYKVRNQTLRFYASYKLLILAKDNLEVFGSHGLKQGPFCQGQLQSRKHLSYQFTNNQARGAASH